MTMFHQVICPKCKEPMVLQRATLQGNVFVCEWCSESIPNDKIVYSEPETVRWTRYFESDTGVVLG